MVAIAGPIDAHLGTEFLDESEYRSDGDTRGREMPRVRTIPRSFAIATNEVTVDEFLLFVESAEWKTLSRINPLVFPPSPFNYRKLHSPTADSPINRVTWYQAVAFCNWLSARHGIPETDWCFPKDTVFGPNMQLPKDYLRKRGYRLPTEAEWEYACRAGTRTNRPCGVKSLLPRYACFAPPKSDDEIARTFPVGSLKPNPFGLHDMLGNVVEWTMEPYREPKTQTIRDDEVIVAVSDDPVPEKMHTARGGSFYQFLQRVRPAYRFTYQPKTTIENCGFRTARTIKPH